MKRVSSEYMRAMLHTLPKERQYFLQETERENPKMYKSIVQFAEDMQTVTSIDDVLNLFNDTLVYDRTAPRFYKAIFYYFIEHYPIFLLVLDDITDLAVINEPLSSMSAEFRASLTHNFQTFLLKRLTDKGSREAGVELDV